MIGSLIWMHFIKFKIQMDEIQVIFGKIGIHLTLDRIRFQHIWGYIQRERDVQMIYRALYFIVIEPLFRFFALYIAYFDIMVCFLRVAQWRP